MFNPAACPTPTAFNGSQGPKHLSKAVPYVFPPAAEAYLLPPTWTATSTETDNGPLLLLRQKTQYGSVVITNDHSLQSRFIFK